MPERRLAAYAEAVELLRAYTAHDPDCDAYRPRSHAAPLDCTCGWDQVRPQVVLLLKVAEGKDECTDCGGSGWRVPAPNEIRRCRCNPDRGAPAYVAGDDAQPARLGGAP